MESGYPGFYTGWQTDMTVPGLQMAPKAPKNISVTELGKPYMLLKKKKKIGKNPVRGINGIEGKGCFKKRMPACNMQDRGLCLSLKERRLETGVSRQRRRYTSESATFNYA